jgi:hypothetical protein
MPVLTAATRVIRDGREVTAVHLSAFAVLEHGEDRALLEDELRDAELVLAGINEVLDAARHDEQHRHHHWWVLEDSYRG